MGWSRMGCSHFQGKLMVHPLFILTKAGALMIYSRNANRDFTTKNFGAWFHSYLYSNLYSYFYVLIDLNFIEGLNEGNTAYFIGINNFFGLRTVVPVGSPIKKT